MYYISKTRLLNLLAKVRLIFITTEQSHILPILQGIARVDIFRVYHYHVETLENFDPQSILNSLPSLSNLQITEQSKNKNQLYHSPG